MKKMTLAFVFREYLLAKASEEYMEVLYYETLATKHLGLQVDEEDVEILKTNGYDINEVQIVG